MNESMLCTKTHEYVLEQDGKYEIGITDYAIEQLGDHQSESWICRPKRSG